MSFDLRPLSVGELLDRTLSLYRGHFLLFTALMAPPAVIGTAIGVVTTMIQTRLESAMADPTSPPELDPSFLIPAGLVFVAAFVAYWTLYLATFGATTLAVSEIFRGRTITAGAALAGVRHHVVRLILIALHIGVRLSILPICFGAAMVLVITGLGRTAPALAGVVFLLLFLALMAGFVLVMWLLLRYAVAVPAVVLERLRATDAIRRSIGLTRGFLGRTFLLTLCAGILSYAAIMIFQMPFAVAAQIVGATTGAGFVLQLLSVALGGLATLLTGPVLVIGLAVLYYDLRIRKEALDIHLLMGDLAVASTTVPPLPASSAADAS